MDQEEARRRCREGGSVLLLDVPAGTEIGMDQSAWVTGPHFAGLKMIPPGFHLLRWRPGPTPPPSEEISGSHAHRVHAVPAQSPGLIPWNTLWLWIEPGDIVVRQWQPQEEALASLPEERTRAYQQGVRQWDFDRQLAPYDLAHAPAWQALTAHITPTTASRCGPRMNAVRHAPALETAQRKEEALRRQAERAGAGRGQAQDEEGLPHTPDTWLEAYRYPSIPARWLPPAPPGTAHSAHAITQYQLDKSHLLAHLLATKYAGGGWQALMGEYEMAFLAFWLGESYESFAHWKALTSLLCACEQDLGVRAEAWEGWLRVLEAQMSVVPSDFFVDLLSCENFLVPALRSLLDLLDDESLPASLVRQGQQLRMALALHFATGGGAHLFSSDPRLAFDEDDEDAPVIVDLDE